ncbi:MAG TPA: response regulator [Candidatus Baltobacteraceae bacterium]|nr:response regulator [Candidatus Baltobacteraceae bacterium]
MKTELPANAKKVLVIDDNKIILKAMELSLVSKGYRVLTADSGAETIHILLKDKPDVILLDLDFAPDAANISGPFRDGFLIIDWARRMCDAEKIPVIMISSTDPEEYKKRAQDFGIMTFLKKPLDKEAVVAMIQKVLGSK